MLPEYGAHPNEVIRGENCYGFYRMSALQVFEQIFSSEQVAVLKQRIEKPYYCSQRYFWIKHLDNYVEVRSRWDEWS